MARLVATLLAALTLFPALTACGNAKKANDGSVEGVILNFGNDYFFPRDGAAAIRVKFGSADLPDGACVRLWAKTEQEETFGPINYQNLMEEDYYVKEDVLVIERRSVLGSLFDKDGALRCGFNRAERIQGLATTAPIESSTFQPKSGNELWWRYDPEELDIAFGPPVRPTSRAMAQNHACLEAMAVVSPPGRFGHLGMSSRGVRILEVVWSAPHTDWTAKDCMFPSDPRP